MQVILEPAGKGDDALLGSQGGGIDEAHGFSDLEGSPEVKAKECLMHVHEGLEQLACC